MQELQEREKWVECANESVSKDCRKCNLKLENVFTQNDWGQYSWALSKSMLLVFSDQPLWGKELMSGA